MTLDEFFVLTSSDCSTTSGIGSTGCLARAGLANLGGTTVTMNNVHFPVRLFSVFFAHPREAMSLRAFVLLVVQ
jgi:hypothetical protein